MKKPLLSFLLLFILSVSAQNYSWQWATRGGGIRSSPGESSNAYDYTSEQINDIVVDNQNNYYFLAYITQQNTEYAGQPISVYNSTSGNSASTDLLLISTTCDGTLRWTQTIGGGYNDFGYKLALDNNGGLYLTAYVLNVSGPGQVHVPPHFSPDVSLPINTATAEPDPGRKTAAVLKYNTANGALVWHKMLQGLVSATYMTSVIGNIVIDEEDNLHVLVGFMRGTHLDGLVTVPDDYTNTVKFFIVKLNSDGEYLSVKSLPMEGMLEQSQTHFVYDENLHRYYIAGFRTYPGTTTLMPLTYSGTAFHSSMFVLAITEDGTEIWRKEETSPQNLRATQLHAIALDDDSNFYIAGKYFYGAAYPLNFSNYSFPPVPGNVVFVMKMSPDGSVLWGTTPNEETSSNFPYGIAINGDEIAVATEMFKTTWGDISINRGNNYLTDPVVLRINKNTGNAFAIHDIMGPAGYKDSFTAIAVDNDGNYITGGYFRNQLFTSDNDGIDTLSKVSNIISYTDFFIAKLAAGPCGIPAKIAENTLPDLKVYPNPAGDTFMISAENVITTVKVYNMLGQLVLFKTVNAQEGIVNISQLSSGTYLLNAESGGKIHQQKVIKR
nr:T9SS type A sorting domain-containing protein [uncultured Flavobacterium sp.]